MALQMITDRTAADVARWRELRAKGWDNMTPAEKAEWLACKGAYNASDLNRVENAVLAVAQLLNNLGVPVSVSAKTDWDYGDVPTATEMARYLNNVKKLREANSVLRRLPEPPESMAGLDYSAANNIEAVLVNIEAWANAMISTRFYAADLYGGEA